MEEKTDLILIKKGPIGSPEDRTRDVEKIDVIDDMYKLQFKGSTEVYHYKDDSLQWYKVQRALDPGEWIVTVSSGRTLSDVDGIIDFGPYIKVLSHDKRRIYKKDDVLLNRNALSDKESKKILDYLTEVAGCRSEEDDGDIHRFLQEQYESIKEIREDTVLASYLGSGTAPYKCTPPSHLIFPFGLNKSQKTAVENAFSDQVSVIKGPPGTGKTQTILNIIANAVCAGYTVAVVSNNNSAVRNVQEKLDKEGLSFFTAMLGNKKNKTVFLNDQPGLPDMNGWEMGEEEEAVLEQEIASLVNDIDRLLTLRNRAADIRSDMIGLENEQRGFERYYQNSADKIEDGELRARSRIRTSKDILRVMVGLEDIAKAGNVMKRFKRIIMCLKYGPIVSALSRDISRAIPYLEHMFYRYRWDEMSNELERLERTLEQADIDGMMESLQDKSMRIFKSHLKRDHSKDIKEGRHKFSDKDLHRIPSEFCREYPVVLSSTYSIKKTLGSDFVYDLLVIDESSQVDILTGALAFSCAKNVVIVGDPKQLPNIITRADREKGQEVWSRYALPDAYCWHKEGNCLMRSAMEIWTGAPIVQLNEHYRCRPRIINFCNQRFYDGELVIMTEDDGAERALAVYRTAAGHHKRGHKNQRQIDVICEEVLPRLLDEGFELEDVGIIAPYNEQIDELKKRMADEGYGDAVEIDTVHRFQGREKKAIILTTVDDVIGDFVNNANLLNVAVSRAVESLTIVISPARENDSTLYGELARYIEYNNGKVINSKVYSVYDLLYKENAEERTAFYKRHRRVSEYDSENFLIGAIDDILEQECFNGVDISVHAPLRQTVHLDDDMLASILTEQEIRYASNPLTHIDVLLHRKSDRSPLMAIEVDGTSFHAAGSAQSQRDALKDSICEKAGIPILRLRTDGSGEKHRVEAGLKEALGL